MEVNKKQNQTLVWLLGFIYLMCQICRTDLSSALVDFIEDLQITKEQASLAITFGYISYAVGMFINSMIIDKVNTKFSIALGMFGCAATHIAIRLLPHLPVIIALWCVNGYIQSIMWPSVMQLTAANLPLEKQESALNIVSVFQQIGSLLCYLITPLGLSWGGWRTVLMMTAAACITLGFIWTLSCRIFNSRPVVSDKGGKATVEAYPVNWTFIVKTHLIPLLLLGIVCGMLRDGISTWTPVLLTESFSMSANLSIALTALLTLGKILSHIVYPFVSKLFKTMKSFSLGLYAICCAICILLLVCYNLSLAGGMLVLLALLLLLNGCLGINYLITIPIKFTRFGRSATVSGVLDSMFYIGSALATWLFAAIADRGGWNATILSWVIISFLSLVVIVLQKQFGPADDLELPRKVKKNG